VVRSMGGFIEHGAGGNIHSEFVARNQPRVGLVTTGKTDQLNARCTSNVPPSRMRKMNLIPRFLPRFFLTFETSLWLKIN
jgi:hypothetical protein